jgi:predicted HD superfamily hydrolase involved in NAD metabolism
VTQVLSFTDLARKVRGLIGQEHRYEHSVRVARCAENLARRHGVDPGKARLAGMLHDLARLYSAERLLREARARGFAIGAREREHPVLLHARVGAALARELFGVQDRDVLSAIEKHTTGADDMTPLDCVVYLADSLEPNRKFPERAALWDLALRDLEAATRETMHRSAVHQAKKLRRAEAVSAN